MGSLSAPTRDLHLRSCPAPPFWPNIYYNLSLTHTLLYRPDLFLSSNPFTSPPLSKVLFIPTSLVYYFLLIDLPHHQHRPHFEFGQCSKDCCLPLNIWIRYHLFVEIGFQLKQAKTIFLYTSYLAATCSHLSVCVCVCLRPPQLLYVSVLPCPIHFATFNCLYVKAYSTRQSKFDRTQIS